MQGKDPVEAMRNYHHLETFYAKAPAYQLNEVYADGRIGDLGMFVDTYGNSDSRRFSPEARALIGMGR